MQVDKKVLYAIYGACSFWAPDTLVHAIAQKNFNSFHVLLATISSLCVLYGTLVLILKKNFVNRRWLFLSALVGIWLFAGLFIMLNTSFSRGGFFYSDGLRGFFIGVFPLTALIMSVSEGSFGALIIATIGLIISSVIGARQSK